jgi:hypothetical protein
MKGIRKALRRLSRNIYHILPIYIFLGTEDLQENYIWQYGVALIVESLAIS